ATIDGRRCRGIWKALQAITRLAHAGCRAGELRVTAFNGRLFSPSDAPAADRAPIDDETMRAVALAVATTTDTHQRRHRILYHDLDVEQLGAVYEHLLDYEARPIDGHASSERGIELCRTGDRRKASGTFYTPRSVTD